MPGTVLGARGAYKAIIESGTARSALKEQDDFFFFGSSTSTSVVVASTREGKEVALGSGAWESKSVRERGRLHWERCRGQVGWAWSWGWITSQRTQAR